MKNKPNYNYLKALIQLFALLYGLLLMKFKTDISNVFIYKLFIFYHAVDVLRPCPTLNKISL